MAYGLALFADCTLQLDRPAEAEAQAREAAEVTLSSWRSMAASSWHRWRKPWCACMPLTPRRCCRGGSGLSKKQTSARRWPQLLRARGRAADAPWRPQERQDQTLGGSATVARSQQAIIELGRTLAVLADAARKDGDQALAAQADAERAAIVERIGSDARGCPGHGIRRGHTIGWAGACVQFHITAHTAQFCGSVKWRHSWPSN